MSDELRKLDERVALEIMGWKSERVVGVFHYANMAPDFYSSNILLAFQVVEKVREQNQNAEVEMSTHDIAWIVNFAEDRMDGAGWRYLGGGVANSLPEAICRAALATLTEQEKTK